MSDRTSPDGPDPAEVFDRRGLRSALGAVKALSGLSLAKIADKSERLTELAQSIEIGSTRYPLVELTKTNVGGFTGGDRTQLPGEAAMITFLLVCGIPRSRVGAWLAALRRVRASPTSSREAQDAPTLPRLPDHFVPRPAERRRVVDTLRELVGRGGGAMGLATTTALHGTGGYGKTTLAIDVCRLPEVQALFPDAIVWIEVGQEPVLTALLADVTARVSGRPRDRYGSIDIAAAALAEALADQRVLLVLDNVWRAADLEPFLRGGPACVRLVTSRRADVLPSSATVVTVDRMEPAQAIDLLRRDLPTATDPVLRPLYERSHRWPVVLGILNGVLRARASRQADMPLDRVVADLARRLDDKGLTGADELADPRLRTVRQVLAIGIQELAGDANGTVLRDRFLSLAAFPPDQLIGFHTLTELWSCDELEALSVCDRLADRSLLGSGEPTGVRLHDVIRDYLLRDHHPPIQRWAQRLLALARSHCTGGRWDQIANAYAAALDWLAFLMVFTNNEDELRTLLLDLRFMVRRVSQGGVAGLAADLFTCEIAGGRDPQLTALSRVLELEGHLALRVDGDPAVAATLWARFTGDPVVRDVVSHRDEALVHAPVATHPMPDRPDRRLIRVSSGHADRVRALSWQPDGAKLATGAADGTVRIWDETGAMLRALELDAAVDALAWSPDHLHLAVLMGESIIVLVDPILGDVTKRLDQDADVAVELTCLAWTPSGLAAGRADGEVQIWDTVADEITRLTATSGSAVRAMQWVAHDDLGLVLAHSDGTLARAGHEPRTSTRTGLNVPRALAVRPGSTQAVIGAATNGLVMVDFASTPPAVVASGPTPGWVTSAGWSHDGGWFAAGLQDGAVSLWSTDRDDGVRDVVTEAAADEIVDTPERRGWERTFAGQPQLDYHGQRVAALTWHPRSPLLAVAAHTDARVFDLRRDPDPMPQAGINCLRRHPYRGLFAAGGMDGELIVFAATDPAVRHTFPGHSGGVRAVAFAPDGERLLTAAEHDGMLLWDVRDLGEGELTAKSIPCPVRLAGGVAWSPDGTRVAVGGDKQITVLDGASLTPVHSFEVPDLVNGLDFDPTGTWLAVATSGSDVGVYSITGRPAQHLSAHQSTVGAVRWVDRRRLASAGYDGKVFIWTPWESGDDKVARRIDPGDGAVWDLTVTRTAIVTVTSVGLLGLHSLRQEGPSCTVALDTALSSCDISADGRTLAAAGSAGAALFTLPGWTGGGSASVTRAE